MGAGRGWMMQGSCTRKTAENSLEDVWRGMLLRIGLKGCLDRVPYMLMSVKLTVCNHGLPDLF
jgi:hypothetical protein